MVKPPQRIYKVRRILKRRRRHNRTEYLVQWRNFSHKFNSWEPADNILDDRLIDLFNSGDASPAPVSVPTPGRRPLAASSQANRTPDRPRRTSAVVAKYKIRLSNESNKRSSPAAVAAKPSDAAATDNDEQPTDDSAAPNADDRPAVTFSTTPAPDTVDNIENCVATATPTAPAAAPDAYPIRVTDVTVPGCGSFMFREASHAGGFFGSSSAAHKLC